MSGIDLDHLDLERLDPAGMHRRIAGMGDDGLQATEAAARLDWPSRPWPRAVAIAGMGGSAISGELLRAYGEKELAFPVSVVRTYDLPAWLDVDSLVVACSYSGNTEETLSAYREARRRNLPRLAISSGGRLQEMAHEDGVPWAGMPPGYPPRAALGWGFFTLLGVFVRLSFLGARERELAATLQLLQDSPGRLGPQVPEKSNRAKQLARALHGRLPVLYSAVGPMESVSLRWRQQLNENAKTLAHANVLPELDHNEIVGWERLPEVLRRCHCVVLQDSSDPPRVRARYAPTLEFVRQAGAEVTELQAEGGSLLQRMFSLLVLGDWVSLYLSFLNDVDPTPVAKIDHLKSELEKARAS